MLREQADRIGFVVAVVGVLALGIAQGQYRIVVRVEVATYLLAVAFAQAAAASVGFSLFTLASGALFLLRGALGDRGRTADPTGHVSAIVPVHRDAEVLHRSVESLLGADYDDHDVTIVVEPGDDAAIAAAERLAGHPRVDYLVNGRPGSKAGAINHAVARTEGEYVAVFDADERVHPRFLRHAVGRLAAGADVVQGRTVPQPTGLIETFAYAESVLFSYAARQPLYLLTGFRMAASRAVVLDRTALEAVGGYDERTLTEDYAFAFDCYLAGLDVRQCLRYPSRIEAAHTFRDWWGQRKRWMAGYAQVFHRQVRRLCPVDGRRDVLAVLLSGGTLWGTLFAFSLLSKFALLALAGRTGLVVAPLAAAVLVTVAAGAVDSRRGAVDGVGRWWLLVPVVIPLYSLAALKALIEYLVGRQDDWYHVAKGSE